MPTPKRRAALAMLTASFALCLLTSAAARAQAPDSTRLGPVVITATRVPIPAGAGASAYTVIRGDELRARGITRVSDALAEVPGAAIVQSGSDGSVTSLFVRGGESDYTKVLVDGVPINQAGGAIDLAHLTTDMVDRIEIVRGPASVLYGSDAVSGVVQIFTRHGTPGWRGTAGTDAGSRGAHDADGSLTGAWRGLDVAVGGGRHTTDGILRLNNAYRNASAGGSLGWSAAGSTVRATARLSDADFHFPTNGAGQIADSNQFRTERRLALGVDAAHRFTTRVDGHVTLASSTLRGVSENEPDGPADTTGVYFRDLSRAWRGSADARLNLTMAPANVLTVGATVERERERTGGASRFGAGAATLSPAFDSARRDVGWYAQWLGLAAQRVAWSAGARVDQNQRFGRFASYRLGATWYLAHQLSLRSAAGNAFKEPAFDEVYNTAFGVGNPALRPEQTRSVEVGADQRVLDGRGSVGVTWFAQDFRDLIQYVSAPNPADPNYFNVARARARGLELSAGLSGAGPWSARAGYTWLRTIVVDSGFGAFGAFARGRTLLRRPAHSASLFIARAFGDVAHAGATLRFVGARDDFDYGPANARVTLAGYPLLDLSGSTRLIAGGRRRPGVRLEGRIANALGRPYAPVAGYAAPGRTLLVGVHLDGSL